MLNKEKSSTMSTVKSHGRPEDSGMPQWVLKRVVVAAAKIIRAEIRDRNYDLKSYLINEEHY